MTELPIRPQHRTPVRLARGQLGDAPASGGRRVAHARPGARHRRPARPGPRDRARLRRPRPRRSPGRAMDRIGRVPVLAAGFAIGAVGGVLAAIGCAAEAAVLVLRDSCSLAWRAARRCWPAPPRATCIRRSAAPTGSRSSSSARSSARSSGPAVFSPLLHGKQLDGDALAPLWLAGSGFMLVALVLVLMVRPDPRADRGAAPHGRPAARHAGAAAPDHRAGPGVIPRSWPLRRASA